MPRNVSDVYAVPAGTLATSLSIIDSSAYNTFAQDVQTDLNTPRPVVAGGTGATTGAVALVNLGGGTVGIEIFQGVTQDDCQLQIGLRGAGAPGMVAAFAQNTAPNGWFKANGAAVNRSTYSDLFAAIGVTYGAGNGTTTFNLPDLRGEFIRGWDDGRGIDTARAIASAQDAAMLNHTHSGTTDAGGAHLHDNYGTTDGIGAPRVGSAGAILVDADGSTPNGTHTHTMTTGNPSTGGGTETRPRNIAMLYCIRY